MLKALAIMQVDFEVRTAMRHSAQAHSGLCDLARADSARARSAQVRAGNPPRDAGFTLLEMLVVMGIIAMLATVSWASILPRMQQARITTAKAQIASISTALELYALDVGTFPPQQVGLAGLLQPPSNTPSWRGPYLKKADGLTDPWGRPYNYKFPGSKGQPEVFTVATDTIPALTSD
jgi:general secretion pathway protein G